MAKSLTARLGLQRWGNSVTDSQLRSEFDNDNAQLEALVAISRQGTAAARGSATTWSRSLYYSTDTGALDYSDGTSWIPVIDVAPWPSYTPVLGGGWTIGNGTAIGYWKKIGKAVHFRAELIFGSTSAAAATDPTVSLPPTMPARGVSADTNLLNAFALDASGPATYTLAARLFSLTTATPVVIGVNGRNASVTNTSPFPWTIGDQLTIAGTYEPA